MWPRTSLTQKDFFVISKTNSMTPNFFCTVYKSSLSIPGDILILNTNKINLRKVSFKFDYVWIIVKLKKYTLIFGNDCEIINPQSISLLFTASKASSMTGSRIIWTCLQLGIILTDRLKNGWQTCQCTFCATCLQYACIQNILVDVFQCSITWHNLLL